MPQDPVDNISELVEVIAWCHLATSRYLNQCNCWSRSMLSYSATGYNELMTSALQRQEKSLQWHHNECDGISNHQPHDCLLNRLFRRRSKKTSKLRVTGLCEGNSPVTSEFPTQRASNMENVQATFGKNYNMTVWILAGNYISFTIAAGLIRLHMPGDKKSRV